MDAKTIKALSGATNKLAGISVLCSRIEARTWTFNGRAYRFAGYDNRKDLVHFTATWSIEGGCGHSRVGVPMQLTLDNQNGELNNVVILD